MKGNLEYWDMGASSVGVSEGWSGKAWLRRLFK